MANLWNEIRVALRGLLRQPGFLAVAVLTLALGIGANTAILALINHAFLAKPPYPEPERVVMLRLFNQDVEEGDDGVMPWAYPYFEDLRAARVAGFEGVAAFWPWHSNLTGTDLPVRLPLETVSAAYFPVLGVAAARGRVFLPEEDEVPGRNPVVLLGHSLWQERYGGDPAIVGKSVLLEDKPFSVVGVMPPGFKGLSGKAEAWVPMTMAPILTFPRRLERRTSFFHQVVGRLRPGVSPAQANGELAGFLTRVHEQNPPPQGLEKLAVRAVPLAEDRVDPAFNKALLILFAAVGFMFLIACVNVVNLQLVRAAARHRETAVRMALGAGRGRLVRSFLAESLVLALLGGALGLGVAVLGLKLVSAYLPITTLENAQLDGLRLGFGVMAANFLLALLTGVLVGILPALRSAHHDIGAWLRQGSAGWSGTLRRLGRSSPLVLLVIVEIALSLLLLVGAGLTLRSFAKLYSVRLGFEPDNLTTVSLSHTFAESFGAERMRFYQQMLEQVKNLPGVQGATVTNLLPVSGGGGEMTSLTIQGRQLPESFDATVGVHMVGEDHFRVMGIPLRRGRTFDQQDRAGSGRVAVLNETAARRFFPGENPLGQRIQLALDWGEEYAEVVGVAGDVKYGTVEELPGPDVYVPFQQSPSPQVHLVVRSSQSPASLFPTLQKTVMSLDPNLPLFDASTVDQHIGDSLSKFRFSAVLLTVFAALACTLAAIGLYGVISYSISRRTAEIGVRMALGARRGEVFGMVLRDALVLSAVGLAIGLALAFVLTRALTSTLYELKATDPVTYVAGVLLLLAITLLASSVPARRAVSIDPKEALRPD